MKYKPDPNTAKIRQWLKKNADNIKRLAAFMVEKGHSSHGIAHALSGHDFSEFRKEILNQFKIK
jgi:hypothetical protein